MGLPRRAGDHWTLPARALETRIVAHAVATIELGTGHGQHEPNRSERSES